MKGKDTMKKLIAVMLCACLCAAAFCVSVYAVPLASGTDALRAEFKGGSGDGLDYRYYAPQTEPDRKYPLVIWLHGIASGNYDGNQIDSYDICK